MKSKRGLSAIVATLLIILLTLIAVGIIWVVIRNIVQSGGDEAAIQAKCALVTLDVSAAQCATGSGCNVTYTRSAGGDDIDGVFIILSNGQASNQTQVVGNVGPGDTRTNFSLATGLSPVPTSAEIAAYFVDASGNERRCNPMGTRTI